MKILVVTTAGMSDRFSKSLGRPCLKCLYSENGIGQSLLYRLLHLNKGFDRYVIVGGFMYDQLEAALAENFQELRGRILPVENRRYADYGSGYSLRLALERIREMDFDEVIFAEGDLYVDRESFWKVCGAPGNVVTYNHEAILAGTAVAFYFDQDNGLHYIYDTSHNTLEIRESFTGIFNSGQVWKFADARHLRQTAATMDENAWRGTNLAFVQKYFGALHPGQYNMVGFREWVNCNTVSDYRSIRWEADENKNAGGKD